MASSVNFARSPRSARQKPGYYEQQTNVPESRLKDRGLILTRVVEAGGEVHPSETITLEEYLRRDAIWTETLYHEIHGSLADH